MEAEAEATTTIISTYIGIDISKSRLDVAVRPAGAGKTTQSFTFSQANSPAGIRALIKQLKAMQPAPCVMPDDNAQNWLLCAPAASNSSRC